MSNTKVKNYIEKHWNETIKFNPNDNDTLLGLPFPYCVPSVGNFDEMYYWDTYFTDKGLAISGKMYQVRNNTCDMLYLVDKYGMMPNGNRTYFLTRSQPPFLSFMVRDVYDYYKDVSWLKEAYTILEKEYNFWQSKRNTECGLNRYLGSVDSADYEHTADYFEKRCGYRPDASAKDIATHMVMACESGWDVTPRWDFEGFHFAPVDLNSLLYGFEKNMEYFSFQLTNGFEDFWSKKAAYRKELMLKYMDDGTGVLLDYNYKKNSLSHIFSLASFYPLFVGLVDSCHADAVMKRLPELETDYGILTCAKNNVPGVYQWNYPNGWACLQYIAVMGMDKYGYKEDALRIAQKFVHLVEKVFDETNNLWEKYNVVEGNINVDNEYKMPPMMGWTAGVYLALNKYIEDSM